MKKVADLLPEQQTEHRAKRSAYMRKYRLRPDVQLKELARGANHRVAHREELATKQIQRYYANHEAELEKRRAIRAANKDKIREYNRIYQRQWRAQHRDKVKAIGDKFRATEHGRHAATEQKGRRKARERGNRTEPRINWKQVWASFNGVCHICEQPVRLGVERFHFDHSMPLAQGGSHSTDNLYVTHATCNLRKNKYHLTGLPATSVAC